MNLTATIAMATLIIINSVVGLLLLFGKLRLVVVRRSERERGSDVSSLRIVSPIEVPKKKRGRPRKFGTKFKTRHLHLPPEVTNKQLGDVGELLQKHQDEEGVRITLHVPSKDGPERTIEIPYPVHWDKTVKERLTTILGGWS